MGDHVPIMFKSLGLIPQYYKKQKHLFFYHLPISMNITGKKGSIKGTDATLKCL
jgi:hypothetical protein